jgi:hypothetical protein
MRAWGNEGGVKEGGGRMSRSRAEICLLHTNRVLRAYLGGEIIGLEKIAMAVNEGRDMEGG